VSEDFVGTRWHKSAVAVIRGTGVTSGEERKKQQKEKSPLSLSGQKRKKKEEILKKPRNQRPYLVVQSQRGTEEIKCKFNRGKKRIKARTGKAPSQPQEVTLTKDDASPVLCAKPEWGKRERQTREALDGSRREGSKILGPFSHQGHVKEKRERGEKKNEGEKNGIHFSGQK